MSFERVPNAEPIAGYRLIEPLGSGGFGEVWKCLAPGGLFKAIKFVFGNLRSLDINAVRAEQEFQALERIKEVRHPFVLSLDRIEDVQGELVIVMELADKSLHDSFVECQSAGLVGIPRETLLRYLRDAAEGLDHINQKFNLQHLDVKPRNLFLISDRVKVADFGLVTQLARDENAGNLGGVTPLYAAPETFQGRITDRSDQYSLAIVYQELLTGQRPFTGKNARVLAKQHMQDEPELRALNEADRDIVARALAKDPENRFPSCLAFIRALYMAPTRTLQLEAGNGTPTADSSAGTRLPTEQDLELFQLAEGSERERESGEARAEEVSRLGITVVQPQSGALRPTLIIGLGGFGRRAVREIRCRMLDRFGDISRLPAFRFLYIDTDPLAIEEAVRGTAEVALRRSETHSLPLQPVGHYRKRMLDHLNEWLPREKLYSVPRSLQTQGSRALGRLAFVDNHLRLLARLKREIQEITHADALYKSVSQTGLALRDNIPRIYVIAAAGGGSSGSVVDLGYTLKRLLHQLRFSEGDIQLMLFCGAANDPATQTNEQANIYATLTELNHFSDPGIPFAVQYGPDGPRLVDPGAPYTNVYLMQAAHRDPDSLRDLISHLGNYLFHELATPLGLQLDRTRRHPNQQGTGNWRSFGTYAVWFPRGMLLRFAARHVVGRLLEEWQELDEPSSKVEVEATVERLLASMELRPEAITGELEKGSREVLGSPPGEALTGILTTLEAQTQQSVSVDDPGNWAHQAVARILEWVGTGSGLAGAEFSLSAERKHHKLPRILKNVSDSLAEQQATALSASVTRLMDLPGRRVSAAESGLNALIQFCGEMFDQVSRHWEEQAARTQLAWRRLEAALQGCVEEGQGNGWSIQSLLFGNRARRQLRVFMDHLAAFARQCLAQEFIYATQQFYQALRTNLEGKLHDMAFCRQRLRHVSERLEAALEDANDQPAMSSGSGVTAIHSPMPSAEAYWDLIRQAGTLQVVLPDDQQDIEKAARRFADSLKGEELAQLDQALQEGVLAQIGGLAAACSRTSDLVRGFILPLLDRAAEFLSGMLPVTDVSQVEINAAQRENQPLSQRVQEFMTRATPMIQANGRSRRDRFLLIPATDAGKTYAEEARRLAPDLHLVRVSGQAHLLFCQEQDSVGAEEIRLIWGPCRSAYEQLAHQPQHSTHSRFDIIDWLPIEP